MASDRTAEAVAERDAAWIADVEELRARTAFGADRDTLVRTEERLRILAAERDAMRERAERAEAERDLCAEFAVRPLPADMVDAVCAAHDAATGGEEARR